MAQQCAALTRPSAAARVELEALMVTKEYQNDFADRYEAIGEARGEAKALVRVLKSRGVRLTSAQEELVTSCKDPDQLDRWLDRAATATSANEVFMD